jgi:hypothetical protein
MKTCTQWNGEKTLEKFRKQNERSERQHTSTSSVRRVRLFEGAKDFQMIFLLRLSLERAARAVKFCRNFSSVLIFSLLLSFVSRQKKVKSLTINAVKSVVYIVRTSFFFIKESAAANIGCLQTLQSTHQCGILFTQTNSMQPAVPFYYFTIPDRCIST